jgi:hypothetical protein
MDGAAILFIDEVGSFPNRETVTHHYEDYGGECVARRDRRCRGEERRRGTGTTCRNVGAYVASPWWTNRFRSAVSSLRNRTVSPSSRCRLAN